jgi:Tol biopolymer transport system component
VSLILVATAPSLGEKQTVLELPQGTYKDLSWIGPDKILFAGRTLKESYEIFTFDIAKQCLSSLIDSKTDLTGPQFYPKQQAIVFTSTYENQSQIFLKSLPTETQCLQWENPNGKD